MKNSVVETLRAILPEAIGSRVIYGHTEIGGGNYMAVHVTFASRDGVSPSTCMKIPLEDWLNTEATIARICLEVP